MAIRIKRDLSIPPENYVIFHHLNNLKIIIPVDPASISDSMGASFSSSTPLSRSAPIQSYSSSGPRTVSVNFDIHRDLCREFNQGLTTDPTEMLITNLQAMVLPNYEQTNKIVNPPLVTLKLRDEIYIKGIVSNVGHTFDLPLVKYDDKYLYAKCTLNFSVTEITPYSASIISQIGQYRNRV